MKNSDYIILAAAILAIGVISGCGNRNQKKSTAPAETSSPETPVTETCFTAIDRYLTEEIGSQYLPGDICIPFHTYADVDDSNTEDIQVWGDFWVMNYSVSGDTLKTVSGGAHPGKMHVSKDSRGHFTVTSFERVTDGSGWEPSARSIFGERFSDFQKFNSDEKVREEMRLEAVAIYVHDHKLPVIILKDYGWPDTRIPGTE